MPVTVVVGLQWGDEGKGKIVDSLARTSDVVVRFQGGANAGHTVVVGEQEVIFHLLPAGVLHEGVENVIANGLVVDPATLLGEIDALSKLGLSLSGKLFLSDRAHIVFPYHRWQDKATESRAGEAQLGTTRRGIGPAYSDKVIRHTAFRFCDLFDESSFRKRLERVVSEKNRWQEFFGDGESILAKELADEYLDYFGRLKEYICDTSSLLRDRDSSGKRILLEGAHGTLLDVDFGTYPYVTSSNCTALGALQGSGLPLKTMTESIGVLKAYSTRVGSGPFPTELEGKDGEWLRERGREYGATTGRPRRCGWFDAVAARYAIELNGIDRIALTKLDVLDQVDPIRVCTSYTSEGSEVSSFPAEARVLEKVEPGYVDVAGWTKATPDVTRFEDLPPQAQGYVRRLEDQTGAPVSLISVGRKRDQIIHR
ncbi:MAG: adenylosuccinate synthase [Planctomycetota bacterium]|nr:adenylosuccinate synthase [Planctomycetota bacterium]